MSKAAAVWFAPGTGHSKGAVLTRMLGVAQNVEARRQRAEKAKEAKKQWEAEQKKRALQEAKARAMGLADQMLMQSASEFTKV